jgi:hypothetical protein
MKGCLNTTKRILTVAFILQLAGATLLAADQSVSPERTGPTSPLQPISQGLSADEIFAKLLEHNRLRDSHLRQYAAVRTYEVTNDKGKVYAQQVVNFEYQAPDRKDFVTVSEEGSSMVRRMVLKRLIESEKEAASGREHHNSAIKPNNYSLALIGEQDLGPYHCYVVQATPRREDKYLFVGKIWISADDFGVVRIEGQPAQKLSFWITRADFVRQYQRIGEFWLPAKDETLVHVRFNGNKILTIVHQDYTIKGSEEAATRDNTEIQRIGQ